ncbi:hypothetical protein BPAE_0001g00140 [Botrytis paeoniae]|uniref:Uncharacterized protein n=1 Tax=Botrytis paeoniae TaxID=278948 RepID=A0A4Z1G6M2_9HELO|nr:hypothetical protein BPAE_0001g00140 [Botrytis paeoniae]
MQDAKKGINRDSRFAPDAMLKLNRMDNTLHSVPGKKAKYSTLGQIFLSCMDRSTFSQNDRRSEKSACRFQIVILFVFPKRKRKSKVRQTGPDLVD